MKLSKLIIICLILFSRYSGINAQTDYTSETKFNQSSFRKVSGNENQNGSFTQNSKVPSALLNKYNSAVDNHNEQEKFRFGNEVEKYLDKPEETGLDANSIFVPENNSRGPFTSDWYTGDVQVTALDVATSGSYRQLDLQQGEDGWLYMAVNMRNVTGGYNANVRVYRSSNGGANWAYVAGVLSTNYYSSISMLVESRNNSIPDSTRILVYITSSPNSNFNDAFLSVISFNRTGNGYYSDVVAHPTAGNRFAYASACSDGMFWSSTTYMHAIVREETNGGGVFVAFHHFRTINWGFAHTSASYTLGFENYYPSAAFSNETGNDSIYIAFERRVASDEWEIRLLSTSEIPSVSYQLRYVTDALSGTLYKRPAITIQQRDFNLPQQILVTCTKNDRAVYHASTDGGATWNIDAALGLVNQPVDFTWCSSDSLTAGGGYFAAAYVDQDGDSVSVRRGVLGAMGTVVHKRNSNQSTGVLPPVCVVYKEGTNKYTAFGYAGSGPTGVYFNMENLVTGIEPIGNTIPGSYSLSQNYPNPFNPETKINFSVPKNGNVKLTVYDVSGRKIEELVNQNVNAGTFEVSMNGSNLSSGVYFYKLETEGFTETKKMVLVK